MIKCASCFRSFVLGESKAVSLAIATRMSIRADRAILFHARCSSDYIIYFANSSQPAQVFATSQPFDIAIGASELAAPLS